MTLLHQQLHHTKKIPLGNTGLFQSVVTRHEARKTSCNDASNNRAVDSLWVAEGAATCPEEKRVASFLVEECSFQAAEITAEA